MRDTDTAFAAIVASLEAEHRKDSNMRYALPDGKVVTGRSYRDIVRAMADEKFTPPRYLETYRTALAARVKALYNRDIDTSSDKKFVGALVEAGLLVKVK